MPENNDAETVLEAWSPEQLRTLAEDPYAPFRRSKPVILIPYGHPKSDKYWQEAFPNCQVVRQEMLPTVMAE